MSYNIPIIDNLSDYKPYISEDIRPYIREKEENNSLIYHYTLYPHDDNLWNNSFLREARGISFDKNTGQIKSRPFHKFFNLHEVPETRRDVLFNNISDYNPILVFDKFDGSLIIVEYDKNNNLICRTKRTYDNIQAQLATEILNKKSFLFKEYIKILLSKNFINFLMFISWKSIFYCYI